MDTSALVPLLIVEPTTAVCGRFWDDADAIVSSRLLYVESAAALAQAQRMGRINQRTYRRSRQLLDQMWAQLDIVEVDEQIIARAADLADRLALRGYDAVHCASAEHIDDADVVAAAGDQRLLTGWSTLGLAVYDTNQAAG
ncbi:MAG TPA: type II toxin-antitoxin system VapC family toxin [Mycobacterium sp.]|nr:type II toxin-antitoxin system VapC family toxin [Mycobacterium sp.]